MPSDLLNVSLIVWNLSEIPQALSSHIEYSFIGWLHGKTHQSAEVCLCNERDLGWDSREISERSQKLNYDDLAEGIFLQALYQCVSQILVLIDDILVYFVISEDNANYFGTVGKNFFVSDVLQEI